jgi:hypothetical protein
MEKAVHFMADRKQRARKELETRCNLQRHTPSGRLPPSVRPHLPKFALPCEIVPLAGDQPSGTQTCGAFIFNL